MTDQTIPPCPVCGNPQSKPNDDCMCCIADYFPDKTWAQMCEAELAEARLAPDPRVAELITFVTVLLDLATDAASGLTYVRDVHGDLYGVGFERVKIKSEVLPVIRLKFAQFIAAQRGEE